MTTQLGKIYEPAQIEDRWYENWQKKNYFHGAPNPEREPYTIVIPPPNVTGMLTMGHVLNNTMQDILIRKARMEGREACWVPGTDHASIATETKVVQMLADQGIAKDDLTREEFLEHAWKWKRKYGGIIIQQLKKLGCSCDWQRERFTMDDGYARAVLEAFVRLYHHGLIYRGHRMVNWCPVSRSAISDEEVLYREVRGHLWYFKYPVKDSTEFVTVATTRPETMLGDTAVAVNPDDERYRHLVGRTLILPLVNREIPVIADKFVDPEFGTGCVKVTPAHDPNDFAMGEAHGLEFINILNEDASLNEQVPAAYRSRPREVARKQVVADLEALGLVEKIEDYTHKVGYSERGNVPIENYISEQWFLKMESLAQPAIAAVREGRIRFHPTHWTKTFNHWMANIKDWCISRQLWWGHRIPVWTHNTSGALHVAVTPPPDPENWTQDPDVLDTWASSWLWPFATFGWPDDTADLCYFYPTQTLITGPDIIFFWVARMIMAGQEFLGDIPFGDVYFTSILRDEQGRKFSKSLGNSPNPFDLFEQFGTDAVRFGIMLMAPQGLDVLFSTARLEVGRNFMNKLWNAARFVQMNLGDEEIPEPDEALLHRLELPERWILSRLNQTIVNVNRQLGRFHFNEGAKVIYEFTWSDFCDWYIEIAKTRFYGDDPDLARSAKIVAVHVLRNILHLLHPYAPFITEELWCHFRRPEEPDLIVAGWPHAKMARIDKSIDNRMAALQDVITAVRTIRSRMNVPPGKMADLVIRGPQADRQEIEANVAVVKTLARLAVVNSGSDLEKPPQSATTVVGRLELFVPLGGLIDLDLERSRLQKRLTELEQHLAGLRKKLADANFTSRAPQAVVEREQQKAQDFSLELTKVKSNLDMLT
ncbi:MAG: valine--tRNA ligase [Candidatus Neomarinimicrobiota bacterium]